MNGQLLKGFYHTPPLWTNQQFGLRQFEFPKLDMGSRTNFELPENLRLGHQMEHVFGHLISSSKEYEVVFNNLLVEEGKTRVGELDFILKNRASQKFIHVELAYKFYIINPDISEPIYRLMGPNKRDMFYTKLDKLKERQLPLLFHDSLSSYWTSINIDSLEIEQQCCFKAQLFVPYLEDTAYIRPLNTNCISGKWIRFDDFDSTDFRNAQYYIPKKLEWVITPHHEVVWQNHYETLLEVNLRMVRENAPMVWARNPSGGIEKLFVVWW
ncbi:DUF1853 family protein [Allomuricauda sp. SCSIO 65647]|uniref:DUF1853 family protein n=1 Tax=Allomuricauda sp. SCSIO 65647 TaxID=2908843 RepID=UPI001F3F7064|nr:DUF1853 family protein [Muricauda sp. SCSIO 65647]UJH67263.1 DUF1853 family protein [Muricauda sp. SCSIO 65647]